MAIQFERPGSPWKVSKACCSFPYAIWFNLVFRGFEFVKSFHKILSNITDTNKPKRTKSESSITRRSHEWEVIFVIGKFLRRKRFLYIIASREFQLNVLNEQVNNVETKSWKISLRKGGSLTYIALPGSQHKTSIFENLEDSCEPRISLSWMCTFQPFYVRLAVPVSNKQMSVKTMYMEASALAKKKPKRSDNYFCTAKND